VFIFICSFSLQNCVFLGKNYFMRLKKSFYTRDVLEVAPSLVGKFLVRDFGNGRVEKREITEVEAYGGIEDLASHAHFGKTERNQLMWKDGGLVYVYFIYGMYWMFNITTGKKGNPQAVLVRGVEGLNGPGKVGRWLKLDRHFYGEDLTKSKRIWLEDNPEKVRVKRGFRIGVNYAGDSAFKKWRFFRED